MKTRVLTALAAALFAAAGAAESQLVPQKPPAPTPPPAAAAPKPQPPPPAATKPQAPPATQGVAPVGARGSIGLMATDLTGLAVPDVRVTMTGPVSREGTTPKAGYLTLQALKPGTYRLRFESPDFITLEREVTVKAGPVTEVDVALNRAPTKPAEPPAAPPPAATRPASPPPPPDADAHVQLRALPDWIEQNLVGRNDPMKETVLGRTAGTTSSVVQLRDPIKDRVRGDADEVIYVIAGQGTFRTGGRDQALDAGTLVVIPRGTTYTLERRGRNPLIALSVVGQ